MDIQAAFLKHTVRLLTKYCALTMSPFKNNRSETTSLSVVPTLSKSESIPLIALSGFVRATYPILSTIFAKFLSLDTVFNLFLSKLQVDICV